MIVTY